MVFGASVVNANVRAVRWGKDALRGPCLFVLLAARHLAAVRQHSGLDVAPASRSPCFDGSSQIRGKKCRIPVFRFGSVRLSGRPHNTRTHVGWLSGMANEQGLAIVIWLSHEQLKDFQAPVSIQYTF